MEEEEEGGEEEEEEEKEDLTSGGADEGGGEDEVADGAGEAVPGCTPLCGARAAGVAWEVVVEAEGACAACDVVAVERR